MTPKRHATTKRTASAGRLQTPSSQSLSDRRSRIHDTMKTGPRTTRPQSAMSINVLQPFTGVESLWPSTPLTAPLNRNGLRTRQTEITHPLTGLADLDWFGSDLRQNRPAFLQQAHAGEQLPITSRGRVIARIEPEHDPPKRHANSFFPVVIALPWVTWFTECPILNHVANAPSRLSKRVATALEKGRKDVQLAIANISF